MCDVMWHASWLVTWACSLYPSCGCHPGSLYTLDLHACTYGPPYSMGCFINHSKPGQWLFLSSPSSDTERIVQKAIYVLAAVRGGQG